MIHDNDPAVLHGVYPCCCVEGYIKSEIKLAAIAISTRRPLHNPRFYRVKLKHSPPLEGLSLESLPLRAIRGTYSALEPQI